MIKRVIQNKGFNLKGYSENNKIVISSFSKFTQGRQFSHQIALQLFIDGFGEAVEKTFPQRKFKFSKRENSLTVTTFNKNGDEIIRTTKGK